MSESAYNIYCRKFSTFVTLKEWVENIYAKLLTANVKLVHFFYTVLNNY